VTIAPGRPALKMATPVSAAPYTVAFMEQPAELVGRALVVVVDDRTAHGDEEDHSGPLVTELLGEAAFVVDGVVVVSADEVEIRNALNTAVIGGVDLATSRPRPPEPSWIVNCSASPRRCARPGCRPASSMQAFPGAWQGSRAAPWWSTSPGRGARCATAWPHWGRSPPK
jgi:hypothetical protein